MLTAKGCVLYLALCGVGQQPPAPSEPVKPALSTVTTNKHQFHLPVLISAADRSRLSHVRLFVSTDKGKTWKVHAEGRPDTTAFQFSANRDGAYWFLVQTEDKGGTRYPPDPAANQQPDLVVIVDSNFVPPPKQVPPE
jgi:hypothetical protein